jgi:hypothetical protein
VLGDLLLLQASDSLPWSAAAAVSASPPLLLLFLERLLLAGY